MQVINSDFQFPVMTEIADGERHPVPGETREISAELEPAA